MKPADVLNLNYKYDLSTTAIRTEFASCSEQLKLKTQSMLMNFNAHMNSNYNNYKNPFHYQQAYRIVTTQWLIQVMNE